MPTTNIGGLGFVVKNFAIFFKLEKLKLFSVFGEKGECVAGCPRCYYIPINLIKAPNKHQTSYLMQTAKPFIQPLKTTKPLVINHTPMTNHLLCLRPAIPGSQEQKPGDGMEASRIFKGLVA
jgi:hypothetical protein